MTNTGFRPSDADELFYRVKGLLRIFAFFALSVFIVLFINMCVPQPAHASNTLIHDVEQVGATTWALRNDGDVFLLHATTAVKSGNSAQMLVETQGQRLMFRVQGCANLSGTVHISGAANLSDVWFFGGGRVFDDIAVLTCFMSIGNTPKQVSDMLREIERKAGEEYDRQNGGNRNAL